ncbi:MAG: hypothetical protein IJ308_04090 [Clostridia bacterium]|nr:hypothetical protein [Clostridia bacterium]
MDAKKGFKKHYVLIGWAIIWVLFLFLALVLPAVSYKGKVIEDPLSGKDMYTQDNGLKGAGFTYWGGFIFINLAFIVVGVVMYLVQRKGKTQANSQITTYLAVGGYFAVAFILNLIFMFVYKKTWAAGVLIPNIVLLLLAALLIMFVLRSEGHVAEVGEKLIEQAVVLENFEVKVSALVMLASDYDVRKALETLHNEVRYADSVSVPAAQQQENAFMEKLVELQEMLEDENADKEEILKLVKKASTAWKIRNEFVQVYNSRKG